MAGERRRLPTGPSERWGADREGDFDERRVMMIKMDTTPAIPMDNFIHSCIPSTS